MLAQIACFPTDKGASVSKYVAESLEIIEKSGLEYRLGPMGTTVEGEPEEVFALIEKIHTNMRRHSDRVYTTVAIDDRKGKAGRLTGKIESLENKLGRDLKK